MIIKADFHIHSCLSPCASKDMTPRNIIEQALEKGLNLIAISDHNSSLNAPVFNKIIKEYSGINCIFGIEACSIEEIHCLCLFDSLEKIMELNDYLYKFLPATDCKIYKQQIFFDMENNILEETEKYFGSPVQLKINEIMEFVQNRDGLFIPSHIDRGMYSLISQYGYLPEENYDAIELNAAGFEYSQFKNTKRYQCMLNSDAHYLTDIGRAYNIFNADDFSIQTIKKLLKSKEWEVKLT